MPRWIGLLGSWALLVLGLGLAAFGAAGEWINMRDASRLQKFEQIDKLIAEHSSGKVAELQASVDKSTSGVNALQNKARSIDKAIDQASDTDQTIMVSTTENKVYVLNGDKTIFEAICSTGKGTTLEANGRTMRFNTPIGKFKVISKEENPMWVPPDWHYQEEARNKGMRVVRLNPGDTIDAGSGGAAAPERGGGVWSWVGESGTVSSSRVLKVKGNSVVEVSNGVERELPAGEMIYAGGAVVIPPIGTPQRKFDKVLGRFRLNLGDGYALHGTQQVNQLGQSVSHGCVRLGDADIERLYSMANVGDEVIIY